MVSNTVNDIIFIEKSAEEKTNIEKVCRDCPYFLIISVIHDVNIVNNGIIETDQVEYLNPTCTKLNKTLIFSQLKAMDNCPENNW